MRRIFFSLFLCSLLFAHPTLSAQAPDPGDRRFGDRLPRIILAGLDAYRTKGPEEAIRTWIKDGPLEGNKSALNQAVSLHHIQDLYGTYQGFEVVAHREISPRARIIYLVIDLDKGPLFAKFCIYRSEQGLIVTDFDFNTKDELVIPMTSGWDQHQ